jgi:hypothetical protein
VPWALRCTRPQYHPAPKADALTLTSAHSFGKVPWQRLGGVLGVCAGHARMRASFVRPWRGLVFSNSPAVSWLPVGGPRMRLKDFGPLTSSISPSRRASVQDSFALS